MQVVGALRACASLLVDSPCRPLFSFCDKVHLAVNDARQQDRFIAEARRRDVELDSARAHDGEQLLADWNLVGDSFTFAYCGGPSC